MGRILYDKNLCPLCVLSSEIKLVPVTGYNLPMLTNLENYLNEEGLQLLHSLDHPNKIQAFLDSIPYSAEDRNRCPLNVLDDRQAHCLDGALFAAAALRRLGDPPLLVDMYPDPGMDDDHVLAIFRRHGRLGAIAKSNFVGLRYREPVYRSLRELVMSYFDDFFNINGVKTLRYYTRPLKLSAFDRLDWLVSDVGADAIERRLLQLRRIPLMSPEAAANLAPVDALSYKAGMLNVDYAGLYKPKV